MTHSSTRDPPVEPLICQPDPLAGLVLITMLQKLCVCVCVRERERDQHLSQSNTKIAEKSEDVTICNEKIKEK